MKKVIALLLVLVMTAAFTVSAVAADFTPSVENKEAPAVTEITDSTGKPAAAIIKDADGNEVAGVASGSLVVTPVSKADTAEKEVGDQLKAAYDQIKSTGSLDEIVPEIKDVVKAYDSTMDVKDLVVRDVFDVSLTGDAKDELAKDGTTVTVRFDLKLSPDALLIVMHNYSGSDWEIIDDDCVARNKDGSVDVTFSSLSPVAFVVDGAEVTEDPNAPDSPYTGESNVATVCVVVALMGIAVLGSVLLMRKKSTVR